MTDTAIIASPERASLDRYLPQSVKDLAWMANEVAKSGIYQNGNRALNGSECFVLMMKGAELGLTPMQSLNEISLIKGKPFVSKDVLTARILRSPRCHMWDPSDMDAKHCTIRFKVGNDETSLTTTIEDIPQRYFAPSRSGEPSNWTLIPEDMLFSWTVRRIARRWFPEALLDIGEAPIDETKVIDVGRVEREIGQARFRCETCGKNTAYVHANPQGGAYLRCSDCGATGKPPQEVRDAVRGTPEHLTLAGASEAVLEPGERTADDPLDPDTRRIYEETTRALENATITGRNVPVDENPPESFLAMESAVQSDSQRDTIAEDGSPAGEPERPIPEPADPEDRHQAMRNAIYAHWVLPRPTASKIEMRAMLEEFGWDGGATLADWMLHLPEDKLAAISEAIVQFR